MKYRIREFAKYQFEDGLNWVLAIDEVTYHQAIKQWKTTQSDVKVNALNLIDDSHIDLFITNVTDKSITFVAKNGDKERTVRDRVKPLNTGVPYFLTIEKMQDLADFDSDYENFAKYAQKIKAHYE